MKVLVISANTERFKMLTMPRDFDCTGVPAPVSWRGALQQRSLVVFAVSE